MRGGSRARAGRPKGATGTKKERISIQPTDENLKWLRGQSEGYSVIVNRLVTEKRVKFLGGGLGMERKILQWFATGSTGVSSEAMAYAVLDIENSRNFMNYPSDPSDFNRCLGLLEEVPDVRENLDKVALLGKEWRVLVENWDTIEKCFIDEVGLNWDKGLGLKASKTYELMKKVIDESK